MRRLMRRVTAVIAASAMVVATAAVTTGTAQASETVLSVDNAIDGRYIVVLNDDAYTTTSALVAEYDGKLHRTFPTINGLAVELSAHDAAKLAADPAVDYVQQDGIVSLAEHQTNPPWGLDRIDRAYRPTVDYRFMYPDSAGAGVTAYILDTGAYIDHPDFGGRMSNGIDTVSGDMVAEDCNGHGTHVAGTVGGTRFGVAKQVDLVAVRVLDCFGSGSISGIIGGIDWVTQNAQKPAVANMSLGGGFNQAFNDAVEASIASGVTYAVAAGNEDSNACNVSPASAPSAITVGATDRYDNRAGFSNFGTCVDLFAPGVDIMSASLNGGGTTMSGTSMASPHVAGAAALHLGEYPNATPPEVTDAILSNASSNVYGNPGPGSPNLLLYTGYLVDFDDFELEVFPAEGIALQHEIELLRVEVRTSTIMGDPHLITFQVTQFPGEVLVEPQPGTITTGEWATLKFTVNPSVLPPPGVYTITLTAQGTMATHSVDYTLTVVE